MSETKYVAYVGTYTHGSSIGIHVYDIDAENGYMTERSVAPVNNASHVTRSKNGKYLYSIADEGVAVLRISPDGDLSKINQVPIDGMRGCFLSTDSIGKKLFVAGYHDGKVTVVHTHRNGRLGSVMDGVFHKGLFSVAERNFRPRVTCVQKTPDDKYLCAVDNGIDQIKIYKVNERNGHLKVFDILRCPLESGPRLIRFSADGRFAYVNFELKSEIRVYKYDGSGKYPSFEKIQTVLTKNNMNDKGCACSGMNLSEDGTLMVASTAGENTAAVFKVDKETGMLEKVCILPISGVYPKDIAVMPDNKTMVVLNHETNDIRFFTIDLERKCIIMKGKPIKVDTPNCILITELDQEKMRAELLQEEEPDDQDVEIEPKK